MLGLCQDRGASMGHPFRSTTFGTSFGLASLCEGEHAKVGQAALVSAGDQQEVAWPDFQLLLRAVRKG